MDWHLPTGFRVAGVHCGLKSNPEKQDVTLIESDRPAVAAGVYTQNLVCAAPVTLDRSRTPGGDFRVVVINSGNANACTGDEGARDAEQMIALAAAACGCDASQALVMSTGIIGEELPMDRIESGIAAAAAQFGDDEASLVAAARGLMTTDTHHKVFQREVALSGGVVRIVGMAKGAAMIGPNMATMLGLVLTDAALTSQVAQELLGEAVDASFNCISVEGHTSTNDTVLLLANGAAVDSPLAGADLQVFTSELNEICQEMARSIPADGEGVDHLITVDVEGCEEVASARTIARTIANSVLVKTAITGADPNWGRIVSAAGYAGVAFDPATVDLYVNEHLLYLQGQPAPFDAEQVSHSIRARRDTSIRICVGNGPAAARFWTTDLTAEYVRLNAENHT